MDECWEEILDGAMDNEHCAVIKAVRDDHEITVDFGYGEARYTTPTTERYIYYDDIYYDMEYATIMFVENWDGMKFILEIDVNSITHMYAYD